jgi:hypothetical protein
LPAAVTEEANSLYEQRDANKRNMVRLQDHLEKSTQSFQGDMQLLQFKIDVLRRMERFMTTKNKVHSEIFVYMKRFMTIKNKVNSKIHDHQKTIAQIARPDSSMRAAVRCRSSKAPRICRSLPYLPARASSYVGQVKVHFMTTKNEVNSKIFVWMERLS